MITGATSGIGEVTAYAFAEEGAKVVVTGRRVTEGEAVANRIRNRGGEAVFLRTDITEIASVQDVIRQTVDIFGALHILFNNAGGSSNADGPVTTAELDEFWRVINLDLFGTFLCCRFAIPEIIKSGGGSVINHGSIAGIKGLKNRDCYSAAKGGVVAMTRSMAANFLTDNVRVNGIAPAGVRTERIAKMLAENAAMQQSSKLQPLGLIDPEEIAQLAVYLGSDYSKSITGEIFHISGGK